MKKAFSLIEVIFVISLIGIISSVAISKFNTTINQTNIIKLKSDILNIQTKLNDIKTNSILNNSLSNTKNNSLNIDNLICQFTPIHTDHYEFEGVLVSSLMAVDRSHTQ